MAGAGIVCSGCKGVGVGMLTGRRDLRRQRQRAGRAVTLERAGDERQRVAFAAREISLAATTERELGVLRAGLSADVFAALARHGLAAHLVAGPALERKLSSLRHASGEPECPQGAAVVYTAVDWARCGRTDPIADGTVRSLWPSYLPPEVPASDIEFDAGLAWALRPVAGSIALLQRTGS